MIPRISFGRISPQAFIYEIIGHSELSTVRLPTDAPSISSTNDYLRLLLRLKWILEASQTTPTRGSDSATSTSLILDKDTLLRVTTYACDISGSANLGGDATLKYPVLRRITLQFLACALRLLTKSKDSWQAEEISWTRSQIEEMVQGWSRRAPLSLLEASIIRELLASISSTPTNRDAPSPLVDTRSVFNTGFDQLLGRGPVSTGDHGASFWAIHDGLLSTKSEIGPSSRERDTILNIYRETLSKLRAHPDHHYSFPLATYMLEELALQVQLSHKLLPHEDIIKENHFLNSFLEAMSAEALAFNGSFPRHISIIKLQIDEISPAEIVTPLTPPTPARSTFSSVKATPNRSANQSPVTQQEMPHRKSLPKQSSSGLSSPTYTTPTSPTYTPTSHCAIPPRPVVKATMDRLTNEVRAYQHAGPVELPTRTPTHRPQQSVPSIEVDEGLHVVESTQFDSTSDYEKMMGMPQLGLRPLSPQTEDTRSISNFSSVGTISGKKIKGLFGRFGSPKKPTLSPLPTSLEFCFSNCAKQIIFWCRKNPDTIIRLRYPFETAQRCDMLVPDQLAPAPSRPQARSIRLLVASTDVAVAIVHIEETRWLYMLNGNTFQPLAGLHDATPAVLSLAVSHDGKLIALGCGEFILVYKLLDHKLVGPWKLDPKIYSGQPGSRVVRLQKLSFSVGSQRLISAVQVEHSTHKHAVYVSVWTCFGSDFTLAAQLDPVYLTVGYSDDTGITSIFLTAQSDSATTGHAFMTAALSKSYPSILPFTPGLRNKHLDIPDKRIEGATQCPLISSPYLCAIRSGRNKIFVIDVRSGTVEKIADFSAERKGLNTRQEHVTIGMQGSNTVYALWRSVDEALVLKTLIRSSDGKWTASTTDLGPVYRLAVEIS